MPRVNVKYSLTRDSVIDTISLFEFQGVTVKYTDHRKSSIEYEGKVKNIVVADDINIELRLHGIIGGKWSLKIEVVETKKTGTDQKNLPIYSEIGAYKKIEKDPIEGTLENEVFYYNESIKIKW